MKEKIIPWLAYKAIDLILFTCRVKWKGLEHYTPKFNNKAVIIMLWHENIIAVPRLMARYFPNNKYAPVISKSRDGQLLTYYVHKVVPNNKIIEVAHNARHKALKSMLKAIKNEYHIVITPDGPKGPRHKIKQGLLYAAEHEETAVLPLTWKSSSYWQLSSWDKMKIPKPFSKIDVEFKCVVYMTKDSKKNIAMLESVLE